MRILCFVRRIFLLAMLTAIGGSLSISLGQNYPYNIEVLPQRGAMPASDEIVSAVDTIEVTTGRLGLEIPLAALPAGHAGSSFPLKLVYDSRFYQMAPGPSPYGTLQYLITPSAPGGGASGTPGGWNYNFQVVGPRVVERYVTAGTCEDNVEQRRRYMAWFVLPDGSAHVLQLSGYGDERNDNYVGDGFYELSMTGHSFCSAGGPAPGSMLTYYTVDGTFLKFEIQANGLNAPGPLSDQAWTLYYPDGSRISGTGSTATVFYDANGNRFRIENHYAAAAAYTEIRDDFDRVIRLDFDVAGVPEGRKRDRITSDSPVGLATWTVDWESLYIDSNDAAPRWYVCRDLEPTIGCRVSGSVVEGGIARELTVVKYVQLPEAPASDDPPEWNSWAFRYSGDAAGGFGELNQVRTPDGARYDYTYRLEWTLPTTAQLLHGNGVASKTVTHDGITDLVWSWTYAAASESDLTTTITQPDGGETVYHYANPTNLGRWDRGLVYRIEGPLGSVIKREWARNPAYGVRGGNNTAAPNNPYIRKESTTVGNAGGIPATAAVIDYAVDKNGNLLSRREYDWVAHSESGIENGATLLRLTEKLYYVETPAASEAMSSDAATYANAYWGARGSRVCGKPGSVKKVLLLRLDAVRRHSVSDATAIRAASEFVYDCAFTSGNVATESHWDNRKSPEVPPLSGMTPANAVILSSDYTPAGNVGTIYEPAIETHFDYGGGASGPYPSKARFGSGASFNSHTFTWNVGSGTRASEKDDQSGVLSTFTYDVYGRLLTATEAGLRSTETTYRSADRMRIVKRDRETPGDRQLQSSSHRDQLGRTVLIRTSDGAPLSETDTHGIKVSTGYTVAPGGTRVVSSTPYRDLGDPTLEWRCVQNDVLGRVVLVSMFAGPAAPSNCAADEHRTGFTVTTYDGARIRIVDPAGRTRDEYRDALGRVVEVREDPNGLNYRTLYSYDPLGNLTQVRQFDGSVKQSRDFAYSSLGRLLSATNPETGTIVYNYDDGGKLIGRTDARSTVTYCYDALHRLEGKRYGGVCDGPATYDVYYTYYSNEVDDSSRGRLASISSWQGSSLFNDYDVFGRPRTSTQTIQTPDGETEFALHYEYRLDGSVYSLTYPSGRIVGYGADAAGRTTQVFSGGTLYADMTAFGVDTPFTADGRLRQMKLGNGLWETRDYQAPNSTTRLQLGTEPGIGDLVQIEYNYTPGANNGNLASQTVRRGGLSWAQSYSYDNLNRVSAVTEAGGWTRAYGYDRYGNRWVASSSGLTLPDVHEPGSAGVYDRQSNRLNNAAYDLAGNQTQAPGNPLAFSYDAENRLVTAESDANGNAYFGYDGDGRRVWKSWTPYGGQTQTTYYVYGLNGEVLAEYGTQPPSPSASHRKYVFGDLLGSVRAITSDLPEVGSATVLECYDYLPFGRLLSQSDNGRNYAGTCHPANPDYALPSSGAEKFTGQERDIETRLDYFGARYYSAAQGRFISPDAPFADQHLRDPQSWNLYAYVRNNPLKYTDPTGRTVAICLHSQQCRVMSDREYKSQIASGLQFPAFQLREVTGSEPITIKGVNLGTVVFIPDDVPGLVDTSFDLVFASQAAFAGLRIGTAVAGLAVSKVAARTLPILLETSANEAVFWSGIKGGFKGAAEWAGKHGGKTLEMQLAEGSVGLPKFDPASEYAMGTWVEASQVFAAGAKGTVRVLQDSFVGIRSFWAKYEFPALVKNPNVTSIISVDVKTGAETVLWKR